VSARPDPPTDVDRAAATLAAIEARRSRAAIKRAVATRERSALDVVSVAWAQPHSWESTLRVTELLGSIPGVGPIKVTRALEDLTISSRKRVGGLGGRQRVLLTQWLAGRHGLRSNRLLVLAGPTAVGKGAVSAYIREHYPEVLVSVSATTRHPRPGEIDGVHYHFVSDDEFDRRIAAGELLEWAVVHNSYRYGTPRPPIEEALAAGQRVMLEIDLNGARSVRKVLPGAFLVFLLPPSWEELVRRLVGRGTETAHEQVRRLETARTELAAQNEFDARVINGEVSQAAREVVELWDAPIGANTSR